MGQTDRNGRATRTVTLPDTLTSYRIMAVAGDKLSRFGSSDSEIRINKPVTLMPAFPRFLAVGDRATFGGLVTSQLPSAGSAVITIRSLDPDVLAFTGRKEHRMAVAPNGSVEANVNPANPGRRSLPCLRRSNVASTSTNGIAKPMPESYHSTPATGELSCGDSGTSTPITVRVETRTGGGNPVAGAEVTLTIVGNQGVPGNIVGTFLGCDGNETSTSGISAVACTQEPDGIATFVFTLSSPGQYVLCATARDLDEAELASRVAEEIGEALSASAPPDELRIHRWDRAMPVYAPGHRGLVAAVRRSLPPNVEVAGASYDGVGVPDCVRSGDGRCGPLSPNSSSIPIGSTGMRMSEKMIAASTPRRVIGCTVTSAARSGDLHRSRKATFSRIRRYSGRYRPA